ncbi:MAG TPA: hypothetical protein VF943_01055 [Burkholderiales bacterium]
MKRLLYALAAVAIGAWLVLDAGVGGDRTASGRDVEAAARDSPAPAARIAPALPARAPLPENVADPFLAPAHQASRALAARAATPAVVAPVLPYRFVGRVYQEGATQVYVARGTKLFAVRQGDVLDGEYRVDALSPSEIAFVHLASGSRQVMPLGPPIDSAARPPEWINSLTLDRSLAGGNGKAP